MQLDGADIQLLLVVNNKSTGEGGQNLPPQFVHIQTTYVCTVRVNKKLT